MVKLKKNTTFCYDYCEDCKTCAKRHLCIRGSALHSEARKYLLMIMGFRQKQTKSMKLGTAIHERFYSDVPMLDDDVIGFFKKLGEGKEVSIKEVKFCSSRWALRGHVDKLTIKKVGNEYFVKIIELKPRYYKTYVFQLTSYALAFSDSLLNLIYTINKGAKKEKKKTVRLYNDNPILNINYRFEYYHSGRSSEKIWMIKNQIVDKWMFPLLRKMKKFQDLHKARSLVMLNELPRCKNCSPEYCSFHDRFCKKIDEKKKEKQYRFSKRRGMVIKKSR